ncbi:MAG: histidine kinase, partial [Blautia sp.]|nr:histidine kinase [Blautia sp.]
MNRQTNEKERFFRWRDLPLTWKVLSQVILVAVIMFSTNMLTFYQLNQVSIRLQQVYVSNVNLTELQEALEAVQNSVYEYLMVKTSASLEAYYRHEEEYRRMLELLNEEITENPVKHLERNIRLMSQAYLSRTADTIQAKRGRNVGKYKDHFAASQKLYGYLNSYLYDLNGQQFKNNSSNFQALQKAINFLGTVNAVMIIMVMGLSTLMLYFLVRTAVSPLTFLTDTVRIVGQGNLQVKMPDTDAKDEVGVLTRTFNTMVSSLQDYMDITRQNMENEQRMKERELLMEAHLKEAQLRYLQSQINPHFLFNSLNAAAQLAAMEDAEKTGIFVERMADFFRYNVKKGNEDATLSEEVESVENYIYILNVRFAGDIHFSQEVDEEILYYKIPSMILQPIVENAVNHGIRNIDWEGKIHLYIGKEKEHVRIIVRDNGKGISQERIRQILQGKDGAGEGSDSTGIGLHNVISRLELYYEQKDLVNIRSAGEDQGTEVELLLPLKPEPEAQ